MAVQRTEDEQCRETESGTELDRKVLAWFGSPSYDDKGIVTFYYNLHSEQTCTDDAAEEWLNF